MSAPRKAHEVVDQILAVESIPTAMRAEFAKIKNDLCYWAPEREREALLRVFETFNLFVPKPPTEPWHYAAAAVFLGVPQIEIEREYPPGAN